MARLLIVFAALCLATSSAGALDLDEKLSIVKSVYGLAPKKCELISTGSQFASEVAAGEKLFESKSLSGNRDISCSTCHLDQFGSADGLPLAVGVGGVGEGYDRINSRKGALVQRNAFSLFARANPEFTSFFWDGKVQVVDGRIVTQFGDNLSTLIESPLAAAAMLPLVERDEFIGSGGLLKSNDIEQTVGDNLYFDRYIAVSEAIRNRLLHPETADDDALAESLAAAGVDLTQFELAHAGNLIAKFIAKKFQCTPSTWDEYLNGNQAALTEEQKRGAVIFYGKGRCASCHAGSMLSDFSFHSIGAPQGFFGPGTRHRDVGRAAVTLRSDDLYLFRTPPLVDVKSTAPYGHNGAFPTLEDIVVYHFNPLQFFLDRPDYRNSDFFKIGNILQSRDRVLGTIDLDSNSELAELLSFLETL